jgi:hypothetical protein
LLPHYSSKAKFFIFVLSLINLGLAAMMGTLGVLSLIRYHFQGIGELTGIFLSVYMVVFATLLFLYELIWWTPIASVNLMFRKNFGFMYGLKGKGFYLIFIAFLCLGLKGNNYSGINGLDWATGIAWLVTGCVSVFVSSTIPEMNDAYRPPTAGLTPAEMNDEATNSAV